MTNHHDLDAVTVYRPLWEWLDEPYQAPPVVSVQMELWEQGGLA